MITSAGVIITDGENILGCVPFGRTKKSENNLDIPKGHIEEGESPLDAAVRECREETGIVLNPAKLEDLGLFNYKPQKNLHIFLTKMPIPEISSLKCTWSPNRWRPWLNFGNNTRFTGAAGINSSAGCTNAGISVYADQFNHANYTPSSNYLTWFYNSTPNGTFTFTLPSWSTRYYIRYGCTSGVTKLQHYDGSSWIDVDTKSHSQATGENQPEQHNDYYGTTPTSKQIRLWEQGVTSIWWIFIQ